MLERKITFLRDDSKGSVKISKLLKESKMEFREVYSNSEQLIGKAAFRITPSLGWAKLIFYEPLRQEAERGFCNER